MGNLRMNADQISYKGGEKPMSVEEAIKNAGNTGLAHTADIALDFSAESAYNAGDLVYHNGTLYVFTANHAAGAWSTEDTQAVTVGGELTSLRSGLTSVNVNVTNSDKLAEGSALWCMRMGKVVVVEYYLIIATDCVANDVLATLDLPANFSINYFNDRLNLKNNTKTLTADSNITTGTTIKGQLVGITH